MSDQLPTPDNLARLPADLQRQIGNYLVKQEPAKCIIAEIPAQIPDLSSIEYRIERNGKVKFAYLFCYDNLSLMFLSGVGDFLAHQSGQGNVTMQASSMQKARGKIIFKLEIQNDCIVYRPRCTMNAPTTIFSYKYFKAAFDKFVYDLCQRREAARKIYLNDRGLPYTPMKPEDV